MNSMIEREPGDIIAELKMLSTTAVDCIYWIVEGVTDIKFFRPRVRRNIELINATGKYKIIPVLSKIQSDTSLSNMPILGIVDNDYDWITNIKYPDNVISTEPRDLEGILLRAEVVQSILAEYASADEVVKFEKSTGKSVMEAVLERSVLFGKIRAVNSLNRKVCLKDFKPIQFCDKACWNYDYGRMIDKAVKLGVSESKEELVEQIEKLPSAPDWHYVRGHDAIDILCGGLISIFSKGQPCSVSKIEPVMRQALSKEKFSATELYKNTYSWHRDRGYEDPFI